LVAERGPDYTVPVRLRLVVASISAQIVERCAELLAGRGDIEYRVGSAAETAAAVAG
jgi:hypothetical protein